ncbi:hypothetical protein AF332_09250 [Sporosarcina globispora]|uniref:Helix-hairpin-helix DNA-binding motif class 1 domain-containing protein n=1 Tax=Sporosarcina globispora TaxID=1459 RepID=A0A0M0GAR0_SPOGL|nr:helix-hairpin-helix domain-containing protein [Sporosarcina globispora]KON86975.1 hypothetical protein AF332_09250 [Sporosarcina globispora]
MAEWIKTNKVYIAGAAITLAALLYYFLLPVQETEVIPEIEQAVSTKEVDDKEIEKEGKMQTDRLSQSIKADIKGAVHKPGVYEAAEGDRVVDLIKKAGGLTDKADSAKINFALNVTDEMVVYVPEKGEELSEVPVGAGIVEAMGQKDEGKVNLNQATEAELQTLPGIGPSKAAAIIEYRETNGSFKDIEDLKLISGIGDKTFEKLREHLMVK